jgi:hypothetical protein
VSSSLRIVANPEEALVQRFRLVIAALATAAGAALIPACRRAPAVIVTINTPAEGDTVRGSAVHITLEASGVELAPVAEQRPGTAHHHLFLDTEPGSPDAPIPSGVAGIIHLGQAQTSFHWDSVPPGEHRIIAVLGNPSHVPLAPLAADTVNFVVVAQ